ncbi:MAG TPA: FG-GAP-like repeat-containing protein [Polyangia bacterium]
MRAKNRATIISAAALGLLLAAAGTVRAGQGVGAGMNMAGGVLGHMGGFGEQIPIEAPPFFQLKPELGLVYSSGGADGAAGVGWSVAGVGVIERVGARRGAPAFAGWQDTFLLDGQELVACPTAGPSASCAAGGTHATKIESYVKIARDATADKWYVWTATGVKKTYAAVLATGSGTFRYGLVEVRDVSGNAVTYNWWCEAGADCYPDTVTYSHTVIKFLRKARTIPAKFAMGVGIGTTNYLIEKVRVEVDGALVREYRLTTEVSPGTGRDRVKTVTLAGSDGTSTLAPATYSYSGAAPSYAGAVGGPAMYVAGTNDDWAKADIGRVGYGDFNGDGKLDIARLNPSGAMTIALANGDGAFASALTGPVRTTASGYWDLLRDTARVLYGDFNGDGKTDIAFVEGAVGSCANMSIYLANGNGTFLGPYAGPNRCLSGTPDSGYADNYCRATNDLRRLRVADVNGDGNDDLIAIEGIGTTAAMSVYLSNGNGTFAAAKAGPSRAIGGTCDTAAVDMGRIKLGDFNGDGSIDIAAVEGWGSTAAMSIYLSNRDGTFAAAVAGPSWTVTANVATALVDIGRVQPADVNGDGKTDLLAFGAPSSIFLSQGNGTFGAAIAGPARATGTQDDIARLRLIDVNGDGLSDLVAVETGCVPMSIYQARPDGTFAAPYAGPTRCGTNTTDIARLAAGDFNGDGLTDLAAVEGWGSGPAMSIYLAQGGPHDLLSAIDNGIGATQSITYAPSTAWANTNSPPLTWTVKAVTQATQVAGQAWSATVTYAYSGGLYDRLGRNYLGFAYGKVTKPCVTGETLCPYDETWYLQDYGSLGKPTEVQARRGDGVLLLKEAHTYQTSGGLVPYTSLETETWAITYDGTGGSDCPGANCVRVYSQHQYDVYGNVTRDIAHGNYELSGDEQTIAYGFYPNTATYVVGRPATMAAYAGIGTGGAKLLETLIYYDGAAAWTTPPVKGLPTKVQKWLNTTNTYLTRQSEYDAYGNVTAEVNETGGRTTMTYDASFQTLLTTANALGHTTTMQWDAKCAAPSKRTDPNGIEANILYDPFCRLTRSYGPSGAYEEKSYVYGGVDHQYFETRVAGPDGGVLWGREYFDGLQRVYRKQSRGPSAGQELQEDTRYDARGQVAQQSLPYVNGGTPAFVTTLRDALDRVVRVTMPDGAYRTTSYGITYNPADPDFTVAQTSTIGTDELGHPVRIAKNAQGQVMSRSEWTGAWTQEKRVRYTYSVRGQRLSATDPLGNVTTYVWDSLGRKISHTDPDQGTWTYAYDAANRVTSQTDAKGQVTTFAYDVLGRKTARTSLAGTADARTVTWTYDQARAGYYNTGFLTTVTDPYGTAAYDYNWAGQANRSVRTIDGQSFTVQKTYDLGGRVLTTTYPDGETVTNLYDGVGRVSAVPGYVNTVAYDAVGQMTRLDNANGTVTSMAFSATRGWLTSIVTTSGSYRLQDSTYTRDLEGKITAVASPFKYESWNYTYDDRHFLIGAASRTNPADSQSFTYDAIGNMVANTRLGCYTYAASGAGSVRPKAVTAAGANSYAYDANGNMVSGAGRTITWDGDNRPSQIGTTTFGYDADGARLKKTTGGVTTYYLGDDYEVTSGVTTKYVSVNGRVVAKTVGATKYWIHLDHLGSVQAISDAGGGEAQRQTFRPYGEKLWSPTGHAEARGFTGQRHDESGLVFLHARYYDPQLARFISPDPVVPYESVVGMNRYAYAGNDPVNHTDSNGLGWFSKLFTGIVKFVSKVVDFAVKFVQGVVNLIKGALQGDVKSIMTLVIMVAAWYIGGALLETVQSTYGAFSGWAAVKWSLYQGIAVWAPIVAKAAFIMGSVSAAAGFSLAVVNGGGSISQCLKAAWQGFVSGFVNALLTTATMIIGDSGASVGLDTKPNAEGVYEGGPSLKAAVEQKGVWGKFLHLFAQDQPLTSGGLTWAGNLWGKAHDSFMSGLYDWFKGTFPDSAGLFLTGAAGRVFDIINNVSALAGFALSAGLQGALADRFQPSLQDRLRGKSSQTANIIDPMGAILFPYTLPRSH